MRKVDQDGRPFIHLAVCDNGNAILAQPIPGKRGRYTMWWYIESKGKCRPFFGINGGGGARRIDLTRITKRHTRINAGNWCLCW